MNKTLKIGIIGFCATIGLALLLTFFDVSPSYIAPFALPWALVIIIGISKKKQ